MSKNLSFFPKVKFKPHRRRPLAPNKFIHLILRSSKAKGTYGMLAKVRRGAIKSIVLKQAKRAGVELRDYVNVGSHLHLNIRFSHVSCYRKFIRSITGLIARLALGAEKGRAKGRFFDFSPVTRVLKSYRELSGLARYFVKNRIEAAFGPQMRTVAEEVEKKTRAELRAAGYKINFHLFDPPWISRICVSDHLDAAAAEA